MLPFRVRSTLIYDSVQHAPGEDQWGYELAIERWLPIHTVETIVGFPASTAAHFFSYSPS